MNQSDAETIGTALADAGFNFAPRYQLISCTPFRPGVQEPAFPDGRCHERRRRCRHFVPAAWLAGKMPVIILETSGILLSTYALMRCHATFGIPILMLSPIAAARRPGMVRGTYRRRAAGSAGESAHPLQGRVQRRRGSHDILCDAGDDELVTAPGLDVMDVRLTTRE